MFFKKTNFPILKYSFIFNLKHQTNKCYFFEQGWGKFSFGKNFLKREHDKSLLSMTKVIC